MARFAGWTMKDVERLSRGLKGKAVPPPKKVGKISKQTSPDYVDMISGALTMLKIDHVLEYKFLHDRRFKFDIAIPGNMIAIEFEGGIFTGGRHTRGKGYANDAKKYNLATMHGWKLFRFTTADTSSLNWEFGIADQIREFINNQKPNKR